MSAWRQIALIGALVAATAAGCARPEDRTGAEVAPGAGAASDTVAARDTTPAGDGVAGVPAWRVHELSLIHI